LVAIVVPDENYAKEWSKTMPSLSNLSLADLCKSNEFNKHILENLTEVAKN